MRIHHLNCGCMRPYGGALMDGITPGVGPATLTCHCLLLETDAGLVLVDTGAVSTDPHGDKAMLSPVFKALNRPDTDPAAAAFNQLRALGHDPADVKHIVMTHLDFDHAAGLRDFPAATVHLSGTEARAARHPAGAKARRRYIPGQWGDIGRWQRHDRFEKPWFGLRASEVLPGIELIWLPGHTDGHCGVAVRKEDGTWLLHAADCVFNDRELDPVHPSTPTGARMFQWMIETSQVRRRRSLRYLRRLARDHADHIQIVCTHDPAFFEAPHRLDAE